MNLKIAKLFCECAEANPDLGIEVEVRIEYSGRGMFGGKTTALIIKDMEELTILAAVAGHQYYGKERDFEELLLSLRELRTDNMGKDLIVY